MRQLARIRSFGGHQLRFAHRSQALDCDMHFSLYLPPQAAAAPVPLLTWLSGLTCTDENFVHKAGAQRAAAEHGVVVCGTPSPVTSVSSRTMKPSAPRSMAKRMR